MPILAKKLNSTRIQTGGGQARWASPKERTGVDPGTTDEFGGGDRRMRVSMYSGIVVWMCRADSLCVSVNAFNWLGSGSEYFSEDSYSPN